MFNNHSFEFRSQSVSKGDYIFRQGEAANYVFMLISGKIRLERHLSDGQILIIHQTSQQESFAEAALFSDFYHCDAKAVKDVKIEVISKNTILTKISNDPEFAISFVELLAKQVQSYRNRLQISFIRSAEERILAALKLGIEIESVIEFSGAVGLTHEACYRSLSKLVKSKQVVKIRRGKYRLAG